ncbi:30S ribosome-binding factor RbfA [Rhodospirillaceae bacterium AH-315-P19]|nr:30S ribosome-binding factor RbfA [Rhodospirillaceae bacterium AH-315-P19]
MASSRGKAPSQRQLRVGEEIRHALADILRCGHFRDPVLRNTPITVTEVRVTPDLRRAISFVMPLGGEGMEEVLDSLRRAAAYLRGQLSCHAKLRHVPELDFQPDVSFDAVDRLEALLHPQKALRHPQNASDDAAAKPSGRQDDGA